MFCIHPNLENNVAPFFNRTFFGAKRFSDGRRDALRAGVFGAGDYLYQSGGA